MDRLPRPFVAFGLGLLLAAAGCRATHSEVPPGRPFAKDGQQRKAIEFSSEGHPISAAAGPAAMPSGLGGSNLGSGIGSSGNRPDGSAFGVPPGAYGAPGTSGMERPGTTDSSTTRASGGSLGTPPADLPPPDSSSLPGPAQAPAPALDVSPNREPVPMPSQTVVPPIEAPGAMGSPNQPPRPN